MMGATHHITGVCAGAFVAWGVRVALVPAPSPVPLVLAGVVGAVILTWLAGKAAYWPDLDHSTSKATLKLGPVTRLIHEVCERASTACFDATATQRDRDAGDFRGHRGLTHFGLTALLFGLGCGLTVWGLTAGRPTLVWGFACGALLGRALAGRVPRRRRRTRIQVGLVATVVVGTAVALLVPLPPGLDAETVGRVLGLGVGVSVFAGMLTHDLGDAATRTGVPLLWPLKIQGHRYYPVHIRAAQNLSKTSADSGTERRIRVLSRVLLVVPVLGWIPGLYLVLAQGVLDLLA